MKKKKPSKKPTPKKPRAKKLTLDDLRKAGGGMVEMEDGGEGGKFTDKSIFGENVYERINHRMIDEIL